MQINNKTQNKNNMSYIFSTTNLRLLPTLEMRATYMRVLQLIDETEYQIESADFDSALAMLKTHEIELDKVIIKSRAVELTETVNKLHAQRVQGLKALRDSINAAMNGFDDEMVEAGKHLHKWYSLHSKNIPSGSQDKVSGSLQDLFKLLVEDEKFGKAVIQLNISKLMTKLQQVNKDYLAARTQRITLWAEINPNGINTRKIINEAIKALTQFINILYFRTLVNPEGTEELVKKLQTESDKTRALVRRTQTIRGKNKEEGLEGQDNDIENDNQTEGSLLNKEAEMQPGGQ